MSTLNDILDKKPKKSKTPTTGTANSSSGGLQSVHDLKAPVDTNPKTTNVNISTSQVATPTSADNGTNETTGGTVTGATTPVSATTNASTITEKDMSFADKNGLDALGGINKTKQEIGVDARTGDAPGEEKTNVAPSVGNADEQRKELKKGEQVGVGEAVSDAIGENEKLSGFERLRRQLEREDERRRAQNEADEKKRRRAAMFTAIGDGINALSNLYFTTKGAPNQFDPKNTMTGRMRERWDRIEADRRREALASRTERMQMLMQQTREEMQQRQIDAQNQRDAQRLQYYYDNLNSRNENNATRNNISQQNADTRQKEAENRNENRNATTRATVKEKEARANKINSGASGGSRGGRTKSSSSTTESDGAMIGRLSVEDPEGLQEAVKVATGSPYTRITNQNRSQVAGAYRARKRKSGGTGGRTGRQNASNSSASSSATKRRSKTRL